MAAIPVRKTDTGIAHLRFMGRLFFSVGPEKMLLGAGVEGLIKA
jgi:hypothetical protein